MWRGLLEDGVQNQCPDEQATYVAKGVEWRGVHACHRTPVPPTCGVHEGFEVAFPGLLLGFGVDGNVKSICCESISQLCERCTLAHCHT